MGQNNQDTNKGFNYFLFHDYASVLRSCWSETICKKSVGILSAMPPMPLL